jgi:uncharacterized protein (DUF427 family)
MPNPAPGFARNPAKALTIAPHSGTVTVEAGGVTIARSDRALVLTEPPYAPAFYIPFADIDFSALSKTERSTHCPYKGDASYWTVTPAGAKGENAMWAYEAPFDETAAIKDHGAFYADRVSVRAG